MENLTRETCNKLSESASFCKRYNKNTLVCFSVQSSNCCSLAKCKCYVSQGRVETLSGEAENFYIFVRQIYSGQLCTKFYHNQSGLVDCISKKHFGVYFWFTV